MEAEKLGVQVMETFKTVLGPEHRETLKSMWNLSHSLKGLGRNAEALSLLQACVQLQEQQLGPAHPDTVDATTHLKAWQKPLLADPRSTSDTYQRRSQLSVEQSGLKK